MRNVVTLNGITSDDQWTLVDMPAEGESLDVPDAPAIVPLKWYQENSAAVEGREDIGVWFDSDDEPEVLGEDCRRFPIIGVNFPKFSDGRGYSIARLLRERYGFEGDLRAVGDVLLDQLFYMKRCGFSTFALRADKDINKAEANLEVFGEVHQAAVDEQEPLFRRRNSRQSA